MQTRHQRNIATDFVIALLFVEASQRARITFLDKTMLDVERYQFVYEWYPENQLQYFNPKLETTASNDVQFAEFQ